MFKKNLISFLAFLFVWMLFGYSAGLYEHFHGAPASVHQNAQCDRASLAQNYYYNGFRFMYPEVNENRCRDGIVSVEMPFTNYLAACLYKVFGYDEFWFRLLSYLFITAGMYALFLLLRLYLSVISSFLLVLLLNSSPIILFYSANFLPDITSLGLMLVAWYLFFRTHIPHAYLPPFKSKSTQLLMILSLGIGIAGKTTCAIQWLTMLSVLGLSYASGFKIKLADRKKLLVTLACSIILPALWYLWSKHLAKTHNSEYFMMRVPYSDNFAAYKAAWQVYLANWPQQTFSEPLNYFAVALFMVLLAVKKYISPALWFISMINFLGSLAFVCLMIEQFRYHDYYIICLFPAFALCWIALAEGSRSIRPKYWWVRLVCFICIVFAFRHQYDGGKVNLRERYTSGNYWEQSHMNSADYGVFRQKLLAVGINRNYCVLIGNDPSPNDMLYLLHLRGHRFSNEHEDDRIKYFIADAHPSYLISNDSNFTQKIRSMVPLLRLKARYKYLHAYEIVY